MKKAPLNALSALLGTAIIGIFVVALAASISAGFAGFWGGLPFWMIVLFVLGLVIYNFFEETIGMTNGFKFMLQSIGIVYSGGALAFGAFMASRYVVKFKDSTFSLPFSDTEHMISPGWMSGLWLAVAIVFVVITLYMVKKRYNDYFLSH